ncbi:hypothetical protein B5F10_11725 [Anaerotruncus colihominis]|uniref:Uncharacterized protein n=1 Tax=Anaerotruncus colihominis TaxID=169435 RepID=A0A1Y4MMB0_9FIRM|nr:hypothetical protein [Anaerotruncus colihominis]OUP69868.1 hypothetical protein B5F11_07750 [Anaerotruncus colihominis]OUP73327.1 hypothetical protein B5F10_11725 [Anaerotruncus colihominis]
MSEQTIQDNLYSIPVTILDKYTCLSLGATTINDLIKTGKLKSVKASKNLSKKPDVLIIETKMPGNTGFFSSNAGIV